MNFNELVEMMERTDAVLRQQAARSIDRALVVRNWLLGCHIVEYEQNGLDRAQYGEQLIQRLADALSARRRRGFSYRSMQLFKRFYLTYRGNLQTASAHSHLPDASPAAIVQTPSAQLSQGLTLPNEAVLNNLAAGFALSWSHYAFLMQIADDRERRFYEIEAGRENWSLAEFKRQFNSGLYERGLCEERGLRVTLGRRWAGAPTVTATAKPAVSPVAGLLQGGATLPDNFTPSIKAGGQELNTARFRKLLEDAGYQYLNAGETGDATGKGWTECGAIDRRGHDMQLGRAGQLAEELDGIVERITELLDAGWRTVRVITDHGWLLVPGGLPKTELPGYLVESRWARCAEIRGESKVAVPKVGWSWNAAAEAAIAPDITAFVAGMAYAHGGLSVQECLIPVLTIQPGKDAAPVAARIKTVEWQRLRCRVTLETPMAGVTVDIRTKANAPDSSLASTPKETDATGQASLIIPDDEQAGAAAVVVLLDAIGNVLSKQATTIGES